MSWPCYVGLLGLVLACAPAQAHQSSDAYLNLRSEGAQFEMRFDIALTDLDRELLLDADDNHQLSWGEVRTRWPDIERLALESVKIQATPRDCTLQTNAPPQLDEHADGRYAVLQQTWQCPGPVTELEVNYQLFAARDATHRGLARVLMGPTELNAVLVPGGPAKRFATHPASMQTAARPGFGGFVVEGMRHIAAGLDHILFLTSLLLVAVWQRSGRGWVPRPQALPAWKEALRLVTAFTVAHSLTLGLAVTGVLAPPTRWVEFLIAASVCVAALDNLRPFLPGPRWPLVFAFGLVHGFGFAGPLQALGLRQGELAVPLLGFNLGVELGQLALVVTLLPLAVALRHTRAYRHIAVQGGSAVVALLALGWMIERGFEIQLF
jgi:hypothetical protein